MNDSLGAPVTRSADVWRGHLVHWKDHATWYPPLEAWLEGYWRRGGKARLARRGDLDLCWDDDDWLDVLVGELKIDIETAQCSLGDELNDVTLRTYHGCRVKDAGVFHREGLRVNNPIVLEAEVRAIVAEADELAWMRPRVDQMIAEFAAHDRDAGRLYLAVDDGPQLDHSGHYCLYGSEWIQCVLGWGAHDALRRRGVPTMLLVDVPFAWQSATTRHDFAGKLLREWVRSFVNGEAFAPSLDFSLCLRVDIPPAMIVGHYHPKALKDPFSQRQLRRTEDPTCPHCRETSELTAGRR